MTDHPDHPPEPLTDRDIELWLLLWAPQEPTDTHQSNA